MATWTVTKTGIRFTDKEALTPPSGTADEVLEQWRVARDAAYAIVRSKVLGVGTTYTVVTSGTATAGHGLNDTITVTVTLIS